MEIESLSLHAKFQDHSNVCFGEDFLKVFTIYWHGSHIGQVTSITLINFHFFKVRKAAKIRKRYNQVPHLTQDTTWESKKNAINITNKSKEVIPFPSGDHKAGISRRESMRTTRHTNTNNPQNPESLQTKCG